MVRTSSAADEGNPGTDGAEGRALQKTRVARRSKKTRGVFLNFSVCFGKTTLEWGLFACRGSVCVSMFSSGVNVRFGRAGPYFSSFTSVSPAVLLLGEGRRRRGRRGWSVRLRVRALHPAGLVGGGASLPAPRGWRPRQARSSPSHLTGAGSRVRRVETKERRSHFPACRGWASGPSRGAPPVVRF